LDSLVYSDNVYRTSSRKVPFLPKLFPSLFFYPHLVSVVARGSRMAKRAHYGTFEWAQSSLAVMRALEGVGVDIEITGIDAFTTLQGPCVFVSNHMSTLETFVLPCIIAQFRDVTFVVKQSLLDYPVFRYVMRSRDPIAVGRTNPREDLKTVMEGGIERLKAGRSLVIFPQTTRMDTFDPAAFNTIAIKLAKRAGVPVVPVALKTNAWGNGKLIKDFGVIDPTRRVHFAFGKPMMIKDRGNEEHQAIIGFITEKLKKWENT